MDEHGEMGAKNTNDDSKVKSEGHVKRAFSKLRHPARWKAVQSPGAMAEEIRDKATDVGEKVEAIPRNVEGKLKAEDHVEQIQSPDFSPAPANPPNTALMHPTTADYAATVGYVATQHIAAYLHEDEGQEVLSKIFLNQALMVGDVARQLMLSEDFRKSCRIVGLEMASGASETLEKSVADAWERLPKFISVSVLPLVAVSGWTLVMGLTLALWRFALFGLK